MKKKNVLNEIKSLMARMDNISGIISEGEYTKTARTSERFIDTSENFVDLLAGLKPGKMFTFGYVNTAKIEVPKYTVKTPGKRGKAPSFPDYPALGRNLGEEGELVNVIKLTMYNFPWQKQGYEMDKYGEDVPYDLRYEIDKPWEKQPSVREKYTAWKAKRDELASKFGVQYGSARYGTEMNNFGGGVQSYKGKNPELAKHTYLNFNLHGIKPFSKTYYLLFADGSIKKIDESRLQVLTSERYDELKKLRDAGATEEDLKILLGMQYQKFENSQILFVSGTDTDGCPMLLLNNNLSDKIVGKTGISKDAILQIARDRYEKVLNGRLNNNLNESGGYVSNDGNGMVGGRWESWSEEGVWCPLSYLESKIYEQVQDDDPGEVYSYIENFYTDEDFGILAKLDVGYDESTGGSSYCPDCEISDVDTSNFDMWIKEIDASTFSMKTKSALKRIVSQMFDDAYDIDVSEYETNND